MNDREHLALIHSLSCVICWHCYGQRVNAEEAHHLEIVRGDHSARATVPLCKVCHVGMHKDRRRAFYLAHKLDDTKLLAWTIAEIERKLA